MRKLRGWAADRAAGVCVAALSAGVGAQSFQGGLRGVVKDAQGVIPGVTVTLVNEANGISRETVTNGVGEYSFPAIEPATYTVQRVGPGLQDLRAQGRPHQHAGVRRPRHPARGRHARGNDHRHRRIAADRNDQRLDRRRDRHQGARVDSDAGPQRVPDGEPRADGADQRQRALEPHAGSGRQLGDVDGRRPGPRQQLPGRRLPGHRPAEPRLDQPDDGSGAGHEGPGPHLRRGDGPHRRRRDEHDGASRAPTTSTAPAYTVFRPESTGRASC